MKTWPTFSVSVKVWVHSDMYIWVRFLDPNDINTLRTGDADLRF